MYMTHRHRSSSPASQKQPTTSSIRPLTPPKQPSSHGVAQASSPVRGSPWSTYIFSSPFSFRSYVTFPRLQALLRENADVLASSIVLEQGKTFNDAHGDVMRGLQVVESACGIAGNLLGDKLEVSKDMDTYTRRVPLGVCARCVNCCLSIVNSLTLSPEALHLSTSQRAPFIHPSG